MLVINGFIYLSPTGIFLKILGYCVVAPQAHFDPVWGLAKWCVRRPFVTVASVSRDFVCGNRTITFSEN